LSSLFLNQKSFFHFHYSNFIKAQINIFFQSYHLVFSPQFIAENIAIQMQSLTVSTVYFELEVSLFLSGINSAENPESQWYCSGSRVGAPPLAG
jgi:ABC-type ATPase involved in cell division